VREPAAPPLHRQARDARRAGAGDWIKLTNEVCHILFNLTCGDDVRIRYGPKSTARISRETSNEPEDHQLLSALLDKQRNTIWQLTLRHPDESEPTVVHSDDNKTEYRVPGKSVIMHEVSLDGG
jgi:hypothetical protein